MLPRFGGRPGYPLGIDRRSGRGRHVFTMISGLQQLASGAVTADTHLAATVAAGNHRVQRRPRDQLRPGHSRRSPSIDSGTARLFPMIELQQGWQLRISWGQPFRAGPPPFVTGSLRGTFPAEPSCKRKGGIELMPTHSLPHVIIVGGGFAGLNAARALAAAPVEVTLVDRRNHHVFQPFLYQVATASLSPADISA